MAKFEVIENKLGMIYNYGFDDLDKAVAYADKAWERLTYLKQTEDYEEFYILICEDPDEESLNHFNGDVFKDYKADAELLETDISDDHTRVAVKISDDIVKIVDSVKDYIDIRDDFYKSVIEAGLPFKDDIKFEFIKEREEPEKAEPVIDYNDIAFELRLIKCAAESIIEKYGLDYLFTAVNIKSENSYKMAMMGKNGVDDVIDLEGNEWTVASLKNFFDKVERGVNHE